MSTIASLDAARVATTQDQAVDYERHLGVRAAVGLMESDLTTRAEVQRVVFRSVERQALLAGCGRVRLEVTR